jgi:hypothetical protein
MENNSGLRKQLEIIGAETINYLRQVLVEKDKRATGNLIQSLDFKVIKDVDGLMLQILTAPYFQYVDEGRRPGKFPPIKPIKSWVKAKRIIVKNQTLDQTAFVIARSISQKGIKPLNLKDKVMRNILTKKEQILKKGAIKDVEELLDKVFYSSIKKELQ